MYYVLIFLPINIQVDSIMLFVLFSLLSFSLRFSVLSVHALSITLASVVVLGLFVFSFSFRSLTDNLFVMSLS